jgi:hypothetical protein
MSRATTLTERGRACLGAVEAHSDTLETDAAHGAGGRAICDQENGTWRRSKRQPSRPFRRAKAAGAQARRQGGQLATRLAKKSAKQAGKTVARVRKQAGAALTKVAGKVTGRTRKRKRAKIVATAVGAAAVAAAAGVAAASRRKR